MSVANLAWRYASGVRTSGQCQAYQASDGKQCVRNAKHDGPHSTTFERGVSDSIGPSSIKPAEHAVCQRCNRVWSIDVRSMPCGDARDGDTSHHWISLANAVVLTNEQALTCRVALARYKEYLTTSRTVLRECPMDELGEALRSVESAIQAIENGGNHAG